MYTTTLYLIADPRHDYAAKCWPTSPIKTTTYQSYSIGRRNNYNFDFGNGLNTSIIINDLVFYHAERLTHIIAEMVETTTKTSHWFVVGRKYLRSKQWQFDLVRDVVTDYWNILVTSNAVINRANSIYSAEEAAQYKHTTQLSQVKSGEILLTEDDGNTSNARGWLVGYLNKSYTPDEESNTYTFRTVAQEADVINLQNISSSAFIDTYSPSKSFLMSVLTRMNWQLQVKQLISNRYINTNINAFNNNNATWTTTYPKKDSWSQIVPQLITDKTVEDWKSAIKKIDGKLAISYFREDNPSLILSDAANEFINTYAGKIIHFADGYYRVAIDLVDSRTGNSPCGTALAKYLITTMSNVMVTNLRTDIAYTQLVENSLMQYTITLNAADQEFIYTTYSINHQSTIGANYDIFMCPLGGEFTYINADGKTITATINESNTRAIISAMMQKLVTGSGGNLYDVQWLPYGYCLRKDLPTINTSGSTKGLSADGTASLIYSLDSNEKPVGCGAIFWCSSTQSNFTITRDFIPANDDTNLMENRINQETYKYRLCSPNWSNGFDFSAVNNDGLQNVDIYCTFKPFQPYIRVAPHFKNLYGAAYNDNRGLILGGEFSLEQVTDAWQQYQLTNKNYQAIFDRQMKTLDLQQKVARENDVWSLVSAGTGAISGGVTNTMRGSIMGGTAGAIAAGAASVIGGVADITQSVRNFQNSEALRSDARSAALDNFQYQVGNIQATPLGLSRVDSFNIDYRVYPVIEVYTCTTAELQNLRTSIQWNGIDIDQMVTTDDLTLQKHLTDTTTEFNYVAATLIRPIDSKNFVNNVIPTTEWLALINTVQSGIYTKSE